MGGPPGNAGLWACGSWGSPMVEIDNPPIGEVPVTAVRSTPTPCSRCQVEPRLPRQRWGRACLTAYARHRREWRRAMRSGGTRSDAATTPPVTPLAHMTRSHDPATPPLPICGQGVPPGFSPGCGCRSGRVWHGGPTTAVTAAGRDRWRIVRPVGNRRPS